MAQLANENVKPRRKPATPFRSSMISMDFLTKQRILPPRYINRLEAVRIGRPEKMSLASTWARHCKELRCAFAAFKSAVSKPSVKRP